MFQYVSVEETLESPELGTYRTFGIKALCNGSTDFADAVFVSDVSTDCTLVSKIAELCTEQQLHPDHLRDVIVDLLQMM